MEIRPIKTEKIILNGISLNSFLDKYIKDLKEESVVAITSKVIAIIENRVSPLTNNIEDLIKKEADFILGKNKYGRFITIKHNALISASGIDQSNGNGSYILLPTDPQRIAKQIYLYLKKKFETKKFGVIITDSRSMPLRVGAMGVAVGFWGFSPLNNYIGTKDLFRRKFQFEKANIVDALSAVAVLVMGEGSEQTPIAMIENLKQVQFDKSRPNKEDLKELYVSLEDDIFHPFYDRTK